MQITAVQVAVVAVVALAGSSGGGAQWDSGAKRGQLGDWIQKSKHMVFGTVVIGAIGSQEISKLIC